MFDCFYTQQKVERETPNDKIIDDLEDSKDYKKQCEDTSTETESLTLSCNTLTEIQ